MLAVVACGGSVVPGGATGDDVGPTLVTAPFARPRVSGAESAERDTQFLINL
jgi:hypothetical protein